jgi:hypothetical protein
MPTPDPNPETYPPYSGQSYQVVHQMDLQGVEGGLFIKTIVAYNTVIDNSTSPPTITQTDIVPAGDDWNESAKYQIHRGPFGLAYVPSQTAPYTTFSNVGYPLAFNTLAKAEAALLQCSGGSAPKYKFYGRDPRKEIAQTIDAYKQNAEEFLAADLQIANGLTERGIGNANSVFAYYAAKLVNQDSNNQFVLGLSAASGGGQNTTYLANSLSVTQLQEAANNALTYANGIPINVPFESPLISDSHASAVEAKNAGEIRDQQIRQTIASAGGVYRGFNDAKANGYSWEGASILMGAYGQAAAASQT